MSENRASRKPVYWLVGIAAAIILAAVGAIGTFDPGPKQPIPFSHHLHVSDKKLNCFFCHPYGEKSANVGIPPVDKCMLCHKTIAPNFAPIAKLSGYYERSEPIPWERVATVPDYVRFSHQCHMVKGHDCSECHGDVSAMDRIVQVRKFDMNFCITCHRENKVTTNCYLCHY